jgi:hypothetical protein
MAVETIRGYNILTTSMIVPLEKFSTVVHGARTDVATDGNKTRGHSNNRSSRKQTAQETKEGSKVLNLSFFNRLSK